MVPILKDGRELSKEDAHKLGLLTEIRIVFAKPDIYRELVKHGNGHTVTLVNGNLAKIDRFGPMGMKDVGGNFVSDFPLLGTERLDTKSIAKFKALAFKELSLYRGLEKGGFRVKDLGTVVIDGITCKKVSFSHASIGTTYEYFEEATGRPVMMESADGSMQRVVSIGESPFGFFRYPREVIITPSNIPSDSPLKQIKAVSSYGYVPTASRYDPETLEDVEDVTGGGDFDFGSLFR